MIDETNTNRIIGDFLEVNAAMIEKREKSKFPKPIAKFIWRQDQKKLLKNIKTLRDSGYILSMENLSELALYVYNNFDNKNYKSIFKVKIDKMITYNAMEMVVKYENITAIFDFDNNSNTFDIKILELEKDSVGEIGKNTYNFTLHRLKSDKNNPVLYNINEELRGVLCDYITDIISLYN